MLDHLDHYELRLEAIEKGIPATLLNYQGQDLDLEDLADLIVELLQVRFDELTADNQDEKNAIEAVLRQYHRINIHVNRAFSDIVEDVRSGLVETSIACFADLHEYVDANEYTAAATHEQDVLEIQDLLDAFIRQWSKQREFHRQRRLFGNL